jgi:glycosyltransferase involved in cell wall biosynthesis
MMTTLANRLAFHLPGLYDGGAERTILNLAKGIAGKGYAMDLVLSRAEGPYMAEIPDSVRLVDLKASRVMSSVPALVRYLHQEQPVALLSALYANIPALWAKRLSSYKGRVILSEQNTLSVVAADTPDLRWRIYPQLANWFYPWADDIIAVSQGVADDLAAAARLPHDRIHVIYNPIVTADLFEKSRDPLEHPWFQAGEPPVVLAVGRLTAQKDFETLIRAFAQVREKQAARLLILGDGEDRSALEDLVHQMGLQQDVGLPGFVSNPYPYMAHSAVFALSSKWEGLPTVLVEAMSLGIPLVSTDCPSGPREILRDGRYGRLVPVGDIEALGVAMLAALAGQVPRPPGESWKLFELDAVIDQYVNTLLGV